MNQAEAQDKFREAFTLALAVAAHGAGLEASVTGRIPWLEEAGTYPEGSRGWWVSAGLKPAFTHSGFGAELDSRVPPGRWPVYLKVNHMTGREDGSEATTLLDVEVSGDGSHLVLPLAAMAVAAVTGWLQDRDTRIEALRERKGRLAEELERVTGELFELDGISD